MRRGCEQAGARLRALIPAGSRVYWDGGLFAVPMLYTPGVNLERPLINFGYTFLKGGHADVKWRSDSQNEESSDHRKKLADFVNVEE